MVRLKTRWLLVRLDVEATAATSVDDDHDVDILDIEQMGKSLFPSRRDLATTIRQTISSHLGIAGEGVALDTQVRLWDPTTRLLLLRVPRDDCGKVRACLTLWTHYEVPAETKSKRSRIVASVLSVNGSARTAKRSALLQARKWYRGRLIQQESSKSASSSSSIPLMQRKFFDKNCRKLQELITIIQAID